MSVNNSRSNLLGQAEPLSTSANGLLYPRQCLFDDEYLQTFIAEQSRVNAEQARINAEQARVIVVQKIINQDLNDQLHQLREDMVQQKAKILQFHSIWCES